MFRITGRRFESLRLQNKDNDIKIAIQNKNGYNHERGPCRSNLPDDGGWISRRNVAVFCRPKGWSPQWPFSGPAAQMVRRATAPKNNGTDRNDPTIAQINYKDDIALFSLLYIK